MPVGLKEVNERIERFFQQDPTTPDHTIALRMLDDLHITDETALLTLVPVLTYHVAGRRLAYDKREQREGRPRTNPSTTASTAPPPGQPSGWRPRHEVLTEHLAHIADAKEQDGRVVLWASKGRLHEGAACLYGDLRFPPGRRGTPVDYDPSDFVQKVDEGLARLCACALPIYRAYSGRDVVEVPEPVPPEPVDPFAS